MLDDLNHMNGWNDHVKELQRGWIGRSYGAQIDFQIRVYEGDKVVQEMPIKIFTTRPDTIFGVSFVALAHDSSMVKELLKANFDNWIDQNAYERYLEQIRLSQRDTP